VPELGLLLRKRPKPGPSDSILQGRYLKDSAYLNHSDRSGGSRLQTAGLSTIISSHVVSGGKSSRNRDLDTTASGIITSGDYYELDEHEGARLGFGQQVHFGDRQLSLSQPDQIRVVITHDFRVESSLA
ncbi:hypothetical protein PG996_010598, partial [Apiospora saccharicola]